MLRRAQPRLHLKNNLLKEGGSCPNDDATPLSKPLRVFSNITFSVFPEVFISPFTNNATSLKMSELRKGSC